MPTEPGPGLPSAWVVWSTPAGRRLAPRTAVSLRHAGFQVEFRDIGPGPSLLETVASCGRPLLIVRAGAWLRHATSGGVPPGAPRLPPRPSPGCGLVAVGATFPAAREPGADGVDDPHPARWGRLLKVTGGDLNHLHRFVEPLPRIDSIYVDAVGLWTLPCLGGAGRLPAVTVDDVEAPDRDPLSLVAWALMRRCRCIHFQPFDVMHDPELRILQVVTSLQAGGAERITLDLAAELIRQGASSRLITLGHPTRTAYAAPPGHVSIAGTSGHRPARAEALLHAGLRFGADLLHGHLIDGEDAHRFASLGWPVVLTIHNTAEAWPEGIRSVGDRDVALWVACSRRVEDELAKTFPSGCVRTVWNGINPDATDGRTPATTGLSGLPAQGAEAMVLISVANPRPQKRLDQLPSILAAVQSRLDSTRAPLRAHLILAGEPSRGNPVSAECVASVEREVDRHGLRSQVHWVVGETRLEPLLRRAGVFVSTSAHEGLSLAQLEALAAGLPVVTTGVGGAPEVAQRTGRLLTVPVDASPDAFAARIFEAIGSPRVTSGGLPVDFHLRTMARRYRGFYDRVLIRHELPVFPGPAGRARPLRRQRGLWLITNNFSPGGAQTSARRLLKGLAALGARVQAAVLQEDPDHPTPGRECLQRAGIAVHAIPPPPHAGPEEAVGELLDRMDVDPPEAVVFWNVMPVYKVLIAEHLHATDVYDVSPGEMYFSSLERYFSRPLAGVPCDTPQAYGRRLAGVVVKYAGERGRAVDYLGRPVHVIPNGVPEVHVVRSWRPRSSILELGTSARIHPQKRLEDLLAAVRLAHSSLPPYRLRIAGGVESGCDDYARDLRHLAAGLHVEWLGDIRDVDGFLQTLDAFLMISEPAGCPNASLEAMAAGLPVVATDVGGASEQVIDGVTGRLIARQDAGAFANALAGIASSEDLRLRMGTEGRRHARQVFGLSRMVDAYHQLFLGRPGLRG